MKIILIISLTAAAISFLYLINRIRKDKPEDKIIISKELPTGITTTVNKNGGRINVTYRKQYFN